MTTTSGNDKAAVLDIRDLVVELRAKGGSDRIIDGISLTARPGETLCVVGESGSGKSVTSLATMGLLPKKSLAVRGGHPARRRRDPKRQRPAPAAIARHHHGDDLPGADDGAQSGHPVGRQIDEVLRTHTSMRERRKRILAMMEQVRPPEVERLFPVSASPLGGQRQRIMIAMALISNRSC